MTLQELVKSEQLSNTLIFGYYGGGNFGDELLLTIIIRILIDSDFTNLKYAYMDRSMHELLNHNYGATPIFGYLPIFKALFTSKNIIVGGGGHWGLDANPTVLAMSSMLIIMRYVMRKKVYLIGVGYYNSTSRLGHLSARMASAAANVVLARDDESYSNFSNITKNAYLDRDIAFNLTSSHLGTANAIDKKLNLPKHSPKTIVTIRNFRGSKGAQYEDALIKSIENNPNVIFVLILLEPSVVNKRGKTFIDSATQNHDNVYSYALHDNPLEIASFFKSHAEDANLVAPQYHAQLIAHQVGLDFLPLSYDNKVSQLHAQFNIPSILIEDTDESTLNSFIRLRAST